MKKFLIALLFVSTATIVLANNEPTADNIAISNRIASCIPLKETYNIELFGTEALLTQQIVGWKNGKCVYMIYPGNDKSRATTCSFTKAQISEIATATKKKGKSTYSGNGITYTSDNPADVVLTKFMNDGTTCKYPD